MEAAGTTVDMVQARLSKTRARQERRLESLLAFVAVTLALVELITVEAAGAFLDWLRPYLGRTPLGDYQCPTLLDAGRLDCRRWRVLYLFIRLMLRLPERRQRRRGISTNNLPDHHLALPFELRATFYSSPITDLP